MKSVLKIMVLLFILSFISVYNGNVLANDMLTLLSPNGGEVIPAGTVYTVQWEAPPEAMQFDLMYSTDEGVTWGLISDGIANTSYDWYTPGFTVTENSCLIKIKAYNSSGERIGEDGSDTMFTISAGN